MRMVQIVGTLLRILPWLLATVSANVIHYRSLFIARREAHQEFMETAAATNGRRFPGSSADEHERLSFNLMQSPPMRRARYKIHVVHCGLAATCIALVYPHLPELNYENFTPGLGTMEGLIVGALSGLVTVHLNENSHGDMRICWSPGDDYQSRACGWLLDAMRIAGAFTTPVQDGLFYYSWLYRALVQHLTGNSHTSYTEVSFSDWNWLAWIACNAAFAVYNGKEWRSSAFAGLASLWVIGRRGQFLDGIWALAICRMTVNCWVLLTGQRQYW